MKQNKVIGIISYLPDDESLRTKRFFNLVKLIQECETLFDLPIYIVIQNYGMREKLYLKAYTSVVISDNYMPLGITGARKKLREWFINSEYDNLIMLDDDCSLVGTKEAAQNYLQQIDDHPFYFGEFNSSLLKLFSISKEIFKQVDFDDIEATKGEGFEDKIFVCKLRKLFPNNRFEFDHSELEEYSCSTSDPNSTWYKDQNIDEMNVKTFKTIKEFDKNEDVVC